MAIHIKVKLAQPTVAKVEVKNLPGKLSIPFVKAHKKATAHYQAIQNCDSVGIRIKTS